MIKTTLSGLVVTTLSGLHKQYVQSLGLGIELPVRMCPRALWQQSPPEPVLIP